MKGGGLKFCVDNNPHNLSLCGGFGLGLYSFVQNIFGVIVIFEQKFYAAILPFM